MFGGANLSIFRVLRILRIFRLLRAVRELKLITSVFSSLLNNCLYWIALCNIYLCLCSVRCFFILTKSSRWCGCEMDRKQTSLDPYGSISEAMFTLFRILTGEDWTDLRYNLIQAAPKSSFLITSFHVSWMVISAFLLNLSLVR